MAPRQNPDPLLETFAAELRARREAADLSRNRLAEALGCSPQWIAKVENCEKPPSPDFARDLDTYFKTGGTFHRIWEKFNDLRKRRLIPTGFRPLAEAEQEATEISIFAPILIPGLVQTEDCARRVLSAGQHPDKAEEMLAIRLARQAILTKPDPPWMFLLVGESVIRDLRPETRTGQCKRFLDVIAQHNVSVQVLPVHAPVYESSGFQLLGFNTSPDVAYIEGAGGHGRMLTDAHDVHRLTVLFNVIRSAALSAEESENLIRLIMEADA
ncbi:helix-turn-helix domain-containing protein [Actinomadura alba]|uniref:Helix-turn-helix domain-containing protein n=1 Tax=Actinomadura alba TaxID=406431 RepID=A0ABR7LIG8_9ACTN|nr:helix-turn-helix transcriptional regulator [Actinomadura alba]MBC6464641.1 helix-turn-helix domain-containing protein [Actinomadura alba]